MLQWKFLDCQLNISGGLRNFCTALKKLAKANQIFRLQLTIWETTAAGYSFFEKKVQKTLEKQQQATTTAAKWQAKSSQEITQKFANLRKTKFT